MAADKAKKQEVKKLYRSKDDRMLAGVCGGIGEYLDIDPTVVRILWIVSVIFGGIGILVYILCAIVIPEE
ncbi:MAG: PspC domain-containing protein [Nanohaloarchaea archaeon]|nr:PspC domain-containing protein [Candidatus Nanohaloarchaea archaeon]